MKEFLEPYNVNWGNLFNTIKKILEEALNDSNSNIYIQHVGSTAVPGMLAKPILDIDIIIYEKGALDTISYKLQILGYISKGDQGIEGRYAFRQSSSETPKSSISIKHFPHHLYVCFSDSLALRNHISFRDALLSDNKLVASYSELKESLIKENRITREEYSRKKTDFILSVLANIGFDEEELKKISDANS